MYIIIGQGAAGTAAANTLRRLDPATPVTVITEEKDFFYSRIDLPDIIAGKYQPAASELQSADAFAAAGITCRMGERVKAIRPDEKQVELASGDVLSYKKLLIATGSVPVMPPLEGIGAKGVHTLWTMQQAADIIEAAKPGKAAVVVGAGLIGLKGALALAARGMKVTVVEKLPRVLPRQLDDAASTMLTNRIRDKGVDILVDTQVEGFVTTQGVVSGVKLANKTLPCDMVIMAIGVKPNTELATATDITTRRGIMVDSCQQTSQPDIYAAGDVAEAVDTLSGQPTVPAIWPVAVEQGQVAAYCMSGNRQQFAGSVAMNSVEIAGMPLVSVGDIDGQPGDSIQVIEKGDVYKKVVIRGNVIRGVLCLGDIRQAGVIGSLVLRQAEVENLEKLVSPLFSYADLIAV